MNKVLFFFHEATRRITKKDNDQTFVRLRVASWRRMAICGWALLLLPCASLAQKPFFDRTHPSQVFGEARNYRIFLPPDYASSKQAYPVIYYCHGHSDRYTLERYDEGKDTVPKIAAFVAAHPVIVVAVDGYVARDYTGFYGGSPWDIREEGGEYDFGAYFRELVAHIDSNYRTLTSRRSRAISGLSMGGFMSLYLSARYPDLIGSASSFNPGPEFYVGEKGRRSLWRPKDHVSNHTRTMVRLIRASGDYISQYHEETREAYARADDVAFEYRRDEYHRHWATSIGETFAFHLRAFADSALDNVPETWSHTSAYNTFEVWNYRVQAVGKEPSLICLEDVTQNGLRVTTRRWAPDGPPLYEQHITITTAPLYQASATYRLFDYDLSTGVITKTEVRADQTGRLTIRINGAGHQLSFVGPGTGGQPPVLLPLTAKDKLRLPPEQESSLPVRIYNPRGTALEAVRVKLTSEYPTVQIVAGETVIPKLDAGASWYLPDQLRVRFTAGDGYFAPTRLLLTMTYDGWHTVTKNIDVLVLPEHIATAHDVMILDGRTVTLNVFRQKGNQGGGSSIQRTVTEGKGNGNGILEPGEEATIWVRIKQGLDPFDKNNWYRAKVHSDSRWLTEVADLQEQKQLEWTSAKERTSVIGLAANTPAGTRIPLLLDNESWSYTWTPDVRYGVERLYQAFQLHRRHLHRYELVVPGKAAITGRKP
ncbi:MAG TPA: alpha/beta hydrolase-fold protein [Blastocatellia bacterium]|nr:alpha/beta hydrolase-fold protein [Blastocatellia bacterium]